MNWKTSVLESRCCICIYICIYVCLYIHVNIYICVVAYICKYAPRVCVRVHFCIDTRAGSKRNLYFAILFYSLNSVSLHFYRLQIILHLKQCIGPGVFFHSSKQCWDSGKVTPFVTSIFFFLLYLFHPCKFRTTSFHHRWWLSKNDPDQLPAVLLFNETSSIMTAFHILWASEAQDCGHTFQSQSFDQIRWKDLQDTPDITSSSIVLRRDSQINSWKVSWCILSFVRSTVILNKVGLQATSIHAYKHENHL